VTVQDPTIIDTNEVVELDPSIHSSESTTNAEAHVHPVATSSECDDNPSSDSYHFGDNIDADILMSVLKAFNLAEQTGASLKNLMEIVMFGRGECKEGE